MHSPLCACGPREVTDASRLPLPLWHILSTIGARIMWSEQVQQGTFQAGAGSRTLNSKFQMGNRNINHNTLPENFLGRAGRAGQRLGFVVGREQALSLPRE